MILSVNICSTHNRYKTFLPRILDQLFGQWEKLPDAMKKEVEIVSLIDNRSMTVGEKRNRLTKVSKGQYIVFVDDDDRVSDDYLECLLTGTKAGSDVITFVVSVSLNGGAAKPCYYSKTYGKDYNSDEAYFRLPNHIMCVKRSLAVMVPFKDVTFGEDADYSIRLKPYIKSEHKIEKTLYYYDWDVQTTEAQDHLRKDITPAMVPYKCDVVILSNAKTEALYQMTQKTIDTLIASETANTFNVLVLEQAGKKYKNAETLAIDEAFNYNRFANIGAAKGCADYVCIANNDLLFQKGWFGALLKEGNEVMSPQCPNDSRQKHLKETTAGFDCSVHFSGWCFVIKRDLWKTIEGFDEDFGFWCADNAVIEQVKAKGITPVIVPESKVTHLRSVTLNTISGKEREAMTRDQVKKFNRKYKRNVFGWGE